MIRGGDGMESMVPNSRFLDGNMTNWTYTSPRARQAIDIRVAYGSPLRTVNDILNGLLARHGLVLKKPAPQVYMAGYDDSGIKFTLNYWMEMTEQVDSARVKSDLLHMIDGAFGDAGITIPFSQKDIRPSPTITRCRSSSRPGRKRCRLRFVSRANARRAGITVLPAEAH